jgi:hypothetical protein
MKMGCLTGHQWRGCLCERCKKVRDEGHAWVLMKQETCKYKCRCGMQKYFHDWDKGKCRRCGDRLADYQISSDPYATSVTAIHALERPPR